MKFTTPVFALALVTLACAADISDLTSKISALSTSITKLNADAQKFDPKSGGYLAALGVDVDANDSKSAINDCTTSANAIDTFSEDNTSDILAQLKTLETTVRSATSRIAVIAPRFKSLGVGGIGKADVAALKNATNTFAIAIARRTPDDQLEEAAELLGQYGDDFKVATAAFA